MNADTNNRGQGYDIGDRIEVECQFLHPRTGVPLDPTTVRCTFTQSDGASTTYTYATSPSDNADRILDDDDTPWYYFRFAPTVAGRVTYRIQATGEGASAEKVEVYVRAE